MGSILYSVHYLSVQNISIPEWWGGGEFTSMCMYILYLYNVRAHTFLIKSCECVIFLFDFKLCIFEYINGCLVVRWSVVDVLFVL